MIANKDDHNSVTPCEEKRKFLCFLPKAVVLAHLPHLRKWHLPGAHPGA